MTREAIIDLAIYKLCKNKKVDIQSHSVQEFSGYIEVIINLLYDEHYIVSLANCIFDEPRQQDEYSGISDDEVIVLRVARMIYEGYKNYLYNQTAQTINLSQTISGVYSTTNTLNVSSINAGAIYSNTITDLEDKIKEIQDEKNKLSQELDRTKSIVDILLQKCQEKGIL